MRAKISVLAFAATLTAAFPAIAKEMHCNVNQDFKAALNGLQINKNGTNYVIKVKKTFKGIPESVSSSDFNKYVNIKFGTEKTKNKDLNVQVRPRTSGECLNGIYNDNKKQIWGGAYCDTSKHKKASSVTLRNSGKDPQMYIAAGAATTTTKQNQFLAFYYKPANEYILTGVCVEDR